MDNSLNRDLDRIPVPNIGDALGRIGVLDSSIRPVWPGARLIGRAYTVWVPAGDNVTLREAIEDAPMGSIVIVNGGASLERALMGELMAARAKARGIGGFVIDGAVRDPEGMAKLGMPVFARGIHSAGPLRANKGYVAAPIAVGGVVVNPGDIIRGDSDGIVVIPANRAESIREEAAAIQQREAEKLASILAGEDTVHASPQPIRGVHHIDLRVPSLPRAHQFLTALGMQVLRDYGVPRLSVEFAFPGEGQVIFEVHEALELTKAVVDHIALGVDGSQQEAVDQLSDRGVEFTAVMSFIAQTERTISNIDDGQGMRWQLTDTSGKGGAAQ